MDDYIFLIIAVVISIFAAIKENKKKEIIASPLIEKEEEPGNYFMDQLFHVDSFEEDEDGFIPSKIATTPQKEPLIAPAPLRSQMNQQLPYKSTLPDQAGKIIQSTFKKETGLFNDEDETETIESVGYLEEFSLRKGFVYSEIMNTKYLNETGS